MEQIIVNIGAVSKDTLYTCPSGKECPYRTIVSMHKMSTQICSSVTPCKGSELYNVYFVKIGGE